MAIWAQDLQVGLLSVNGVAVLVMHLHGHFARYWVLLIPTTLRTLMPVLLKDVVSYGLRQLKLLAPNPVELARLPIPYNLLALPVSVALS